ncbi:MAG: hypothetical protein ACO3S8_07300, partial [Aquiluna sp.]
PPMSEEAQAAPASPEERVEAMMFADEPSAPEAQPEPLAQEDQGAEFVDEVTAEDIPVDDEPLPTSAVEELDLVYNGETLKVSLDEARNLAQLGHHLKTQQEKVAGEFQAAKQQAEQIRQFVAVQAQATSELRSADVEASNLEAQLRGIDQNELARIASDDPARYVEIRAQIDVLQQRYQSAVARRNQAIQQFQQAKAGTEQTVLANEASLLQKIAPIFRDQSKAQGAVAQIQEALKSVRPETVQAVSHNAELMAMALDAAKYRALQSTKREKVSQARTAKPGTSQTPMKQETAAYLNARKTVKSAKTSQERNDAIMAMMEARL